MSQYSDPGDSRPMETSVPQRDGASLLGILDELGDIVLHAKPVPMSASVRVNRAELLELVEAAKNVVPTSISVAESIIAESEDLRARAQSEADRLVNDAARRADATLGQAEEEAAAIVGRAKEQGDELVADERVVHLAEQRAREIVAEARAEAARMAGDSNAYVDRSLAEFEERLAVLTKQAAAGRDAVARRRDRVEQDLASARDAADDARRAQADDPALRAIETDGERAGAERPAGQAGEGRPQDTEEQRR